MSIRFTINGAPEGEVKAVFNVFAESPTCTSVRTLPAHRNKDGTITQTFVIEMVEAKRYAERSEKPLRRDKQGWVYLLETPYEVEPPFVGIFKMGHTKDMQDRKALYNVKLPFDTKVIHTAYSQDRYALERELKRHYAKVRLNGSEFLKMTVKDVSDFCALG